MRMRFGRPGVRGLVVAVALALGCGGGAAPGGKAAAGADAPSPSQQQAPGAGTSTAGGAADAGATAGACAREPDLPAWSGAGRSDACDGLAPAAIAPREIAFPAGSYDSECTRATADASGALAAGVKLGHHAPIDVHVWSGAAERGQASVDPDRAWLTPAPRGFLFTSLGWQGLYPGATRLVGEDGSATPAGVVWPGGMVSHPHAHFGAPDGSVLDVVTRTDSARVSLVAARLAPGGAVLAGPWTVVEAARDFAPRSCLAGADCTFGAVAAAADAGGDALVVWDARPTCGVAGLAARWFDAAGAPLGPPFVAAEGVAATDGVVSPMALAPLVGGGLALRVNGEWVRRFEPRRLAGGPPPDWLAARPGLSLAIVRGGRAHALLPPRWEEAARVPACADAIEIVAPSGRSCGTASFPGAACDGGVAPFAGDPSPGVGLDGTVVRAVALEPCGAPGAAPLCCRYRWWEGALR